MVNAEEVLDPRALSLEELRALLNRLQMEDDEVSYVRRVAVRRGRRAPSTTSETTRSPTSSTTCARRTASAGSSS